MNKETNIEEMLKKLRKPGTQRVQPPFQHLMDDNPPKNLELIKPFLKFTEVEPGFYMVPKVFLRSAIFSAAGSGGIGNESKGRRILNNTLISSQSNYTITATGNQLRQNELDVWLQCLELMMIQNCNIIEFKPSDFLKSINRDSSTASKEWLEKALSRLSQALFRIDDQNSLFEGKLITNFEMETSWVKIYFDKNLPILFDRKKLARISKNQRQKLGKKSLSKWLHGYYLTHSIPNPIKISTIYKFSGSTNQELRFFEKNLKKSIANVTSITGWNFDSKVKDILIVKKKNP